LGLISQEVTERFYNLLAVGESAHSPDGREAPRHAVASQSRLDDGVGGKIMGFSFAAKLRPEVFVHARRHVFVVRIRDVLRTVSEYWKRPPQMRQCHCSRAKMYGRHSESFGSSLEWGIFKSCKKA
jgi:hypothetical protein